jgi:uncharacterized protein YbjT (DUF2867 family)
MNDLGAWGHGPILVTGAAGFVGAAALHELIARRRAVHAMVRPVSVPWWHAGVGLAPDSIAEEATAMSHKRTVA